MTKDKGHIFVEYTLVAVVYVVYAGGCHTSRLYIGSSYKTVLLHFINNVSLFQVVLRRQSMTISFI